MTEQQKKFLSVIRASKKVVSLDMQVKLNLSSQRTNQVLRELIDLGAIEKSKGRVPEYSIATVKRAPVAVNSWLTSATVRL